MQPLRPAPAFNFCSQYVQTATQLLSALSVSNQAGAFPFPDISPWLFLLFNVICQTVTAAHTQDMRAPAEPPPPSQAVTIS